ncbi:lysylphosphatidylglycerol synthase transmembrane domain-containing protein [Thermococcus sp. Bubb.Bath]|uniref:lysylphosphatidylglycerol synthase transmembrane domain-containing protein n=1 Tax=Thermococcus sp. Bubb.Bath TaxID=1638242 RepID=UPI00143B64BC|nr:lysylphosphatidylglycerol synthase transmembrane domain-containing protein [Thermococcus sp. Bubb.Bath]NJF25724.1 flippase-like domain-containing protein [Thermococcus sp. Bubb.Bath]
MDWRKALPFVAGITVMGALIWWAGTEGVLQILGRTNLFWLGMAVSAYMGGVLTWALRWHVLIKSLNLNVKFKDTFVALFVGILFNNITPGARGGGEAFRMYYLTKRSDSTYGEMLATITADRILDLVPVMIMLLLSTFYAYAMGVYSLFTLLLILDILLMALTGIATVIITSERRMKRITFGMFNFLERLVPSKVKKHEDKFNQLVEVNIPHFTDGLKLVARDRRAFLISLGYSFITWFFVILRNYLVFISLGQSVSFTSIMIVQMIATTVGLISIIPGGAGIIEAISAGSFVLLGITRDMAVTASILDRIISFWLPLFLGSIFLSHSGLKPREVKGEKAAEKEIQEAKTSS